MSSTAASASESRSETHRARGLAKRAAATLASTHPGGSGAAAAQTRRWVPRAALVGALAAVTIVAPLTGSMQPDAASASTAPQLTIAERLSVGQETVPVADGLVADPEAQARAVTTASRGYVREALVCPVESTANGALSAVMDSETAAPDVLMPVAEGSYRVTSRYGYRTYPFAGMHEGTDLAGAAGTPLYAVTDGVVTYVGGPRDGRTGTIVIIQGSVDGQAVEFWYGHQYADGPTVSVGQQVEAGDVIGKIGNAGRSTGPHVHFEVRYNGNPVDPYGRL